MRIIKRIKGLFVVILFLPLFMVGCSNDSISSQLAEVDSLLVAEQNDSAYHLIQSLDENKITNPEDRAHFNLLYIQTSFLVSKPLSSDSLLDAAIAYYLDNNDKEKLAECYYYKGISLYLDQDPLQSMLYYKKAEEMAKEDGNIRQQYKIAEGISYINCNNENYDIALMYAQKALDLSLILNNKRWLANAYFRMGIVYSNLGITDSTFYYFNKTEPYITYIFGDEKTYTLLNLGMVYMDTAPEKAKKFLQESLSYKETTKALEYLAEIAYEVGNEKEAYQLWKRALTINDHTPKDKIIHNLLEYDIERGKTDEVCDQVNEIIAIKDSIINKVKNDTIRDLQMRFDHQVEMNAANERLIRWQWVLDVLGLFVFLLVGIILWMRSRSKLKLKDRQLQISHYASQLNMLELRKSQAESQIASLQADAEEQVRVIEELKVEKVNAEQELQRLNVQLDSKLGQEVEKVSRGYLLYEDIEKGKTTQLWKQDDYEAFAAYYCLLRRDMVRRAYRDYPNASPRNLFYLILKDMGKSTEEICRIMCIEKDSLRSIVYRLNHISQRAHM